MNWWHYLLLANLYLALFYGFYLLLLRKETYFMLNRVYLVSAAILSFFIPMIQAEWVKNLFITQKVQQTIYYIDPGFVYQVSPATESGFTISQFFAAVYWLVTVLLLARLIYRFVKLYGCIQLTETGAFSFFGKVKVDESLPQREVILQHEMVHVTQLHSADVLFFEALAILNWFNPVIYFYRKAIKYNHEFIADRDAVSFGIDKSDYAMLLLSQSLGVEPNTLVNSFFNQSLLKQRIFMLHKNPSRRAALLKYGLSAPLFAAMLILTSATVSEQKTLLKISEKINSDTPVKEAAKAIGSQINVLPKPPASLKTSFMIVPLKGKVVNVQGKPLADVKVFYDKKGINTATDADGDFTFPDYTEGDPLTFKYSNKIAESATITSFTHTEGKLQIVVFPDRRPTMANSIIADTHPSDSDAISFAAVEMLPSFMGGEEAFGKFLASHIRYPKVAKDNKITGRVIVTFIVEKDGKLTNIKVLRDIGGGCGEEAIRVLSESPAWNPGIQNGKKVRVAYTMPINFTLAGDAKSLSSTKTTRLDSASNPELYKRGVELMKKTTSVTISGFGGPDSARQRKPSETIPLQAKMMGLNDPLYILDGTPIDKGEFSKIKPNDIESISVFRSAKATERYGDKGKNGVIEITMKKGKKP
jgi:TonB family protein